MQNHLQALHPNSAFTLSADWLDYDLDAAAAAGDTGYAATLALESPYIHPIRQISRLDPDPLQSVLAALEGLAHRQSAALQILFAPTCHPWSEILPDICRHPFKRSDYLFTDLNDRLFHDKFSSPLFAVSIRLAATTRAIFRQLLGWANHFSQPPQKLIVNDSAWEHGTPTPGERHTLRCSLEDRCTFQPGIILNALELAALMHLPGPTITADRLQRITVRTKPTPAIARPKEGLLIGENHHQGKRQPVYIPTELRHLHSALFGATGTGKSTSLLHWILSDILHGRGVAVFDPHADLVTDILARIPKRRLKDVVYFNPTDSEFPIGVNLLHTGKGSEPEQERVVSDMMTALKKHFSDSWGPRLQHLLFHLFATIVRIPGGTLRDVRRLLLDDTYRGKVIAQLRHPDLLQFWHNEFPKLPQGACDPIHNKISPFLLATTIRNIICQSRCLDFDAILNQGKIFLANLSTGLLTESISGLLGSALVTQLVNAAFRRATIPKEHRQPFYCYIDEWQNFVNVSSGVGFERILSETRKYAVFLTSANQYTAQLLNDIMAAVNGNIGTIVSLRLGADDARILARQFAGFSPDDLMALERGHALVRLGTRNQACTIHTFPPPNKPKDDFTADIIAHTRKTYARTKAEVEAEMNSAGPTTAVAKAKPKKAAARKKPAVPPPPSVPDLDDFVS